MTILERVSPQETPVAPQVIRHKRRKTTYWLVPGICIGALMWIAIFVAVF